MNFACQLTTFALILWIHFSQHVGTKSAESYKKMADVIRESLGHPPIPEASVEFLELLPPLLALFVLKRGGGQKLKV